MTIWFIDANVTVGSVLSDAIGPHHQEPEYDAGAAFPQTIALMGHGFANNLPP